MKRLINCLYTGLTAFMLLLPFSISAQQHAVTGQVLDRSGEPLFGVNVIVQGTSIGSITDEKGNYVLNVPGAESKIVASIIGYNKVIETVGDRRVINFKLIETDKTLDDVVVVGYGTVKRRDLTGAVASITGNQIAAVPVTNVAEALQGRLPGVNIISQDGRPGATMSVKVRGGTSITQSNNPLYIVDGYPVASLDNIPAYEIESIDVLKDAASTAIYGARGSNGVILVTTKNPSKGKLKVDYSGYAQVDDASSALNAYKTLDAQDYLLFNWGYATALGSGYASGVSSYYGLGSGNGNHWADYANVNTHNYTRDLIRTAFSQSHNVSVSGGNETTKAMFNLGYDNNEGTQLNSGLKRYNASFKLQYDLAKNLKFDADLFYTNTNVNNYSDGGSRARGSIFSNAYMYRPIDNTLGSGIIAGFGNGDVNIDNSAYNVVDIVNNHSNVNENENIRGIGALTWNLMHGLTAHTELGLNSENTVLKSYTGNYGTEVSSATLARGHNTNFNSTTTLNYDLKLAEDQKFSLMVGNEVMNSKSETTTVSGTQYPDNFNKDDAFGQIDKATLSTSFSNVIGTPSATVSFFERANYSYKGRYLLTATLRADGSSKFAPNNRWGYFPAAALAWRISDEPFMEENKSWLDNLKLRLSYGASGSDAINSNLWKESWSVSSTQSTYELNGVQSTYYTPGNLLANYDLKWETTLSRNIGIDFGFFDNRVNGTIDIYNNRTKDLLMPVKVNASTGHSYQYQNVGDVSNKGVELSLGGDIIRSKDFTFSASLIYNFNRNRIERLAESLGYNQYSYMNSNPSNEFILKEGYPVGAVQCYRSDGWYTVDDFNYDPATKMYSLKDGVLDLGSAVYVYPSGYNKPSGQTAFPGALKIKDVNGDKKITNTDYKILGGMQAEHTGSFAFNIRYKNFDFNSNFNYVIGGYIFNYNRFNDTYGNKESNLGANRMAFVAKAYRIYNVNSNGDIYLITDPDELNAVNAHATMHTPYAEQGGITEKMFEDGSYLRLKTLTIGYSLPKRTISKVGISNMRVYFTANNLLTFSGYSGADPEVNTVGSTSYGFPALNIDVGSYPRAKTYTIGLNLEF